MASFAQMTAGAPAGLTPRQAYFATRPARIPPHPAQRRPGMPMAGGGGTPNVPPPSAPMAGSPPPAQVQHQNTTLMSGYAPPPAMTMPAGRTFARFGTR